MPVLSPADHAFFDEQGYVIVHDAVPRDDLEALLEMVDRLVGLDPSTWYKPPHHDGAFIEAYHQQALWNTRQRPCVYGAFAELFGMEKITVGVDRASMKLPMHPDHPGYGEALPMHWDVRMDGRDEQQIGLQGVLAITDTTADMGGFACVPGVHKRVREIVQRQGPGFNGMRPDLGDLKPVPIPMKAGDLLIWTVRLLHGSLENRSDRPRLAQYIKFGRAATSVTPEQLQQRRATFATSPPPGGWKENPQQQQPREWACKPEHEPVLTDLGRKIAGLDPW